MSHPQVHNVGTYLAALPFMDLPGGQYVTGVMVVGDEQQVARPDWDTWYLGLAEYVSLRSPDPHTHHGCVLVDPEKRPISFGYNGPVQGLDHLLVPQTRPEKYRYYIHAEENALLFSDRRLLMGATAYITGFPCPGCFMKLVQAGVVRVVIGGRGSDCIKVEDREAVMVVAKARNIQFEERA